MLIPKRNEKLLLKKLQGLVTNLKWEPEKVADLFTALLKRFNSTPTNTRAHLYTWMMKMLHCIEIHYVTPSWACPTGKMVFDLIEDKTVADEDVKKCLADDSEKKLDEILNEIRKQELNQIDEMMLKKVKNIVSSVEETFSLSNGESQLSGLEKDLLNICKAAEKTKFKPQLTQMVSWCIMALSDSGRLIQVCTGEGKSCTVAMFAAFRAMKGEKVDIMSSSLVLAERDMKDWEEFYKTLNISVSCNTNKHTGRDLKLCYEHMVVYGTAEEFAGDWLKQHFSRSDIFGQRKFQCVIADEVDSLMLDKGHHVVYLSTAMPAMRHLSPLFALIWATVNQYAEIGSLRVRQQKPFQQVVLENIKMIKGIDEFTILQLAEDSGMLAKGSARAIRNNPSLFQEKTESVTVNQLVEFFNAVEIKFPLMPLCSAQQKHR
ncbi:hypothetical protein LDENG_00066330 [Lucifuga dentata]|nr:hypothetical protein LDENG_00066330 [Lucifuga dentata]